MLVPVLEGQLGDPGLVQFAKPFRDHAIVLVLGRSRERKIEPALARQFERDAAVLGGVRGGEETGMVAVLHVFAVGLKNARSGAGLRKDFA